MKNALVIVDVQRDFLPGGALAVDHAEQILPEIRRMAPDYDLVVATRDDHPAETRHFDRWPEHCVTGTTGSRLHPDVRALADHTIYKGQSHQDDGYSGFEGKTKGGDTLREVLTEAGIGHVVVVGLALDWCVKATALDAKKAGFDVSVDTEATRPVDNAAGLEACAELIAAGVIVHRWSVND